MAQNSAIHHLREERRLRDQFAHELRNIFLTFGSKGFLIARPSPERDDYNFLSRRRGKRPSPGRMQNRPAQSQPSSLAQEVTARTGQSRAISRSIPPTRIPTTTSNFCRHSHAFTSLSKRSLFTASPSHPLFLNRRTDGCPRSACRDLQDVEPAIAGTPEVVPAPCPSVRCAHRLAPSGSEHPQVWNSHSKLAHIQEWIPHICLD